MELLSRNESVFVLSLLVAGYVHHGSLPIFTSLHRVRSGTLTAGHTRQDGGREEAVYSKLDSEY